MDSELVRKDAKRAYKAKDYRGAADLYASLVENTESTAPRVLAADRVGYASALTSLNLLDEAAVQLEAALAFAPGDARLHFKLGEVLSRLGRHGDAAERFQSATELDPGGANNHWRLAMELHALGRDADSRKALARCLEIEPDHTEAQLLQMEDLLSQSPERDGQFEEINPVATSGIVSGHSGQLTATRPGSDMPPVLIFLWALGLLLGALWVRMQIV